MKKFSLLIFSVIMFGFGCKPAPERSMPEKVSFQTTDGVTIVGDYYANTLASRTVLLLHMRPETRISWQPFAEELVKNGFAALAIDLRGHGDSTKTVDSRMLDYKTMSESEEANSIQDVKAAAEWLKWTHGVTEDKLDIVGASIGANLALQYQAEFGTVRSTVLLSPGLVYRGVDTQPMIEKLQSNQRVYFIAAKDDAYAALSVGALAQKTTAPHEIKMYDTGGHAMKLFEAHPELVEEIIQWMGE